MLLPQLNAKTIVVVFILLVAVNIVQFSFRWTFSYEDQQLLQNQLQGLQSSSSATKASSTRFRLCRPKINYRSLLVYAYWEASVDYAETLQYFFEVGVRETDPVDYVIVVNGYNITVPVPNYQNVFVVPRENVGFDSAAWMRGVDFALENLASNLTERYKYFFFLNSSVRGPFLPVYWYPPGASEKEKSEVYHWTKIFTSRINERVKLVGPSHFCVKPGDHLGTWDNHGPKVEGYFWATDYEGLQRILPNGPITYDFRNKLVSIMQGEYMTSKVILEANYNVDSLLMAYANKRVDWADRKNWLCGDTQPSSRVGWYFGHTLHPLEVVFHKRYWNYLDQYVELDTYNNYSYWTMQVALIKKLRAMLRADPTNTTLWQNLRELQQAPTRGLELGLPIMSADF